MGQEIVYCFKCRTRILAAEFERKEAFLFKERPCCRMCMIQLLPTLTPEEQQSITSTRVKIATPKPRRIPTPPPAPPPEPPERKRVGLIIGAAAAGLVVVTIGILLLIPSRPDMKPETAKPIKAALDLPIDPLPVKSPLDDAREYRKLHPDDLAGQIRAYKKLMWDLEGTPLFNVAQGELEPLLARRRKFLEEKLRAIEAGLKEKFYDKEYKTVLDEYRAARDRFDDPEWSSMVDAKSAEISNGISDFYSAIKARAVKARQSGDESTLDSIRRDIARWGIESYKNDFESAFPASKEHVLPAARLRGSGTFRRAGRNWVSESDSDARVRKENYVEGEFEAAANVRYRCYVLIGGCCQETMSLFVQATDLSGTTGNGERRSLEPGSSFYLFRGHPQPTGPKTHAEHGGEKEPSRWEWRSIELPPYPVPGKKKLRLLTNSRGFSVAGILVTSEKYIDAPPQDLDFFDHQ